MSEEEEEEGGIRKAGRQEGRKEEGDWGLGIGDWGGGDRTYGADRTYLDRLLGFSV
jgi:hypothetical protein